jgi:type IV fimbrial biogenesis protein FimT
MNSDRIIATSLRPTAGFTVIELIITVAVLAILVAVATPSFRELSLNNRTTSATNNLLADLALARNEAVKTARIGYVSAAGGDWSAGWAVWVDANGNGTQDVDEPNLRTQPPVDGDDVGNGNAYSIFAASGDEEGAARIAQVGFGPMGQARDPAEGARFAICRPDGDREKSNGISIEVSGRAQSVRGLAAVGLSCS